MKQIKSSIIDGKVAKLILLDDNDTLKITLENKVINTINGIWNNIKNEEWAQLGLLKIEVETYIEKDKAKKELEAMAKELF